MAIDVLGRAPLPEPDGAYLRGGTVVVTGAGGSIGSQLCRQVLRAGAGRLALLDHAENALYEVDRALRQEFPEVPLVPVLGSVCGRARLERVFRGLEPAVVFHAAAYKHVPLLEGNADEAVLNIVGGTRAVLAAAPAGARVVAISTDKAVEPTGVMGACKRVAELLVEEAAAAGARATVVRFGNVFGTSGSVVPLFQEQIRRGGPVTVAHPEVERFFMTAAEAVSLVIEAGGIGRGGEVFVLDMGEPVLILDLARRLIREAGREPGVDVPIVFTGLRPGEKLRERLLFADERPEPTANPRICVARGAARPPAGLAAAVAALEAAARGGDEASLAAALGALVPGYGSRP